MTCDLTVTLDCTDTHHPFPTCVCIPQKDSLCKGGSWGCGPCSVLDTWGRRCDHRGWPPAHRTIWRKKENLRSDRADQSIAKVAYERGVTESREFGYLMQSEHSRSPLSRRLAGTTLKQSAGAVRTLLISSGQKSSLSARTVLVQV